MCICASTITCAMLFPSEHVLAIYTLHAPYHSHAILKCFNRCHSFLLNSLLLMLHYLFFYTIIVSSVVLLAVATGVVICYNFPLNQKPIITVLTYFDICTMQHINH